MKHPVVAPVNGPDHIGVEMTAKAQLTGIMYGLILPCATF